jgi:hypothetical protein
MQLGCNMKRFIPPEKIPTKENSALPGAALKSQYSQTKYTVPPTTPQQKSHWSKGEAHAFMADSARRMKAPRHWQDDPISQRNYRRVFCDLPERAGFEAAREIEKSPDKIAEILARYAQIPDGLLEALDCAKIPSMSLMEVPHA